ncbi:MAG: dihydropteroate synthase [Chitinophagales bacterium]
MHAKTTYFPALTMLSSGGRLIDFSTPRIMGILNVTPDSFYRSEKFESLSDILHTVETMLTDGADIIDVGGMSTRPGAKIIDVDTELKRVIPVVEKIKQTFPQTWLSIDTVHAKVAEEAVHHGADIINDISAGAIDTTLLDTVAALNVPYILMHMKGLPSTMQDKPVYENVVEEVFTFFIEKLQLLHSLNTYDVIIDPGFGFGKNTEDNYALASNIKQFQLLGKPILAGISRKSMICKLLKVNPEKALNGTTALNALLLFNKVNIIRVHDVKEAKEVLQIVSAFSNAGASN